MLDNGLSWLWGSKIGDSKKNTETVEIMCDREGALWQ